MAPKLCQICNEAQSKYKCPSCLAPYCSLVCFKQHKDVPCEKLVKMEEKPTADSELPVHKPLSVEGPGEVLQTLQLQSIASSSEIRSALEDENLQRLIRSIDSSADPGKELDKAMDVEAFRILSDKIFSSLNPSLQE